MSARPALQSPVFQAGIELVVTDPSAPYAFGIRTALPGARIAVDTWHLVALANLLTQVRARSRAALDAEDRPTRSAPRTP